MENSETSNSINEDQNDLSRKFLKITNVKMLNNTIGEQVIDFIQ